MIEMKLIQKNLEKELNLKTSIEGSRLYINGFDEYIKDYDTYTKIEDLAISLVNLIIEEYDVDCDYEILAEHSELAIDII